MNLSSNIYKYNKEALIISFTHKSFGPWDPGKCRYISFYSVFLANYH